MSFCILGKQTSCITMSEYVSSQQHRAYVCNEPLFFCFPTLIPLRVAVVVVVHTSLRQCHLPRRARKHDPETEMSEDCEII